MIWLSSWLGASLMGLAVAAGVWWLTQRLWWGPGMAPRPSAFLATVSGVGVVLLLHYAVPQAARWLTVQKIVKTQEQVTAARAELETARQEAQALRQRLAAYAAKEKAYRARISALEALDREHVRRRQELDQVVIPPAIPVESRDQAMAVFRRYTR